MDHPRAKVFFIINTIRFFLSHRRSLALSTKQQFGCDFVVYAPADSEVSWPEILQKGGVPWLYLPYFSRARRSPLAMAHLLWFGIKMACLPGHHVFHLVSIFPMIFVGTPLRLMNRRCLFTVSGFGTMFSSGYKLSFLRHVVLLWYRFLFNGKRSLVMVQNIEAKELLLANGVLSERIVMNQGSTVTAQDYPFQPKPIAAKPVILVPARLVRDKGILEVAQASKILQERGFEHEVWFAGDIDSGNPLTLAQSDVEELKQLSRSIRFLGHRKDLPQLLQQCDIVCLPTYHEGLPRSLIEAACCGRPIVATDIAGVRAVVEHQKSALLVPVKAVNELALAIEKLAKNPSLAETLVAAAQKKFQRDHSEELLVGITLQSYQALWNS